MNIVEIIGVSETEKKSFGLFTDDAVEECLDWLKKEWGDKYEFVVNPPKDLNTLTEKNGKMYKWNSDDISDSSPLLQKLIDLSLSLMKATIGKENCPHAFYNMPRETDSCENCDDCERHFFQQAEMDLRKEYKELIAQEFLNHNDDK